MASKIDRRVEEFAARTRCMGCRDIITSQGCVCSRKRVYQDKSAEIADWYANLPENVKTSRRGFQPLSSVRSTLTRERRRAGLADMPTQPVAKYVGGSFGGASASQDERLGLMQEHSLKPKWFKPTQGWTKKADLEPI